MNRFALAVAPVSLLTPSLTAAFEGPYAPELWTFTTEAGGLIDQHTADTLILVGGDISLGGGAGSTDLAIVVVVSGTWSFHWAFVGSTSPGFDTAYYIVNDVPWFLSNIEFGTGSIRLNVEAGDVIGFRVDSADGIFGPGILTITNFTAPVPGPPAFAFILAAIGSPCRRRRYDSRDDGK